MISHNLSGREGLKKMEVKKVYAFSNISSGCKKYEYKSRGSKECSRRIAKRVDLESHNKCIRLNGCLYYMDGYEVLALYDS